MPPEGLFRLSGDRFYAPVSFILFQTFSSIIIEIEREGANMKHRIVTAAQMKEIERAGDAHGLPYLQMMENAGLAA